MLTKTLAKLTSTYFHISYGRPHFQNIFRRNLVSVENDARKLKMRNKQNKNKTIIKVFMCV